MNNLIDNADRVKAAVDDLIDGIEKDNHIIPREDRNMKSDGIVFQCWRNMADFKLEGKTISDVRKIPTLNKMIFKTWNNVSQECADNLVIESIKKSAGANYSYMTLVPPGATLTNDFNQVHTTTIKSKGTKQ